MAPRVLRRFGFRRTLVCNGIIATAGYATCGLFSPAGLGDVRRAGVLGLLHVAPVHRLQHPRLRRHSPAPDERATAFYSTFQH
jgi:hypothetical protein